MKLRTAIFYLALVLFSVNAHAEYWVIDGVQYSDVVVQKVTESGVEISCRKADPEKTTGFKNYRSKMGTVEFQKLTMLVPWEQLSLVQQAHYKRELEAKKKENKNANIAAINEINPSDLQKVKTAAEQGDAQAQFLVGKVYNGVDNIPEAIKWFSKAANQGHQEAQYKLGSMYATGKGVPVNNEEAARWYRKSAEQGNHDAQYALGICYEFGTGVIKDYALSYAWLSLASVGDSQFAKAAQAELTDVINVRNAKEMGGETYARQFEANINANKERIAARNPSTPQPQSAGTGPIGSGSGFFISDEGYIVTNNHVVKDAKKISVMTAKGALPARVVKTDADNDLAVLKIEGHFSALPIDSSRVVKLGDTVATIGFPNPELQGFAPKLSKGEIGSLSGSSDDARYFQISAAVQPGNSGGALVDERGNVVGIVSAKLDARTAFARSGALPENINYAVKSSYLLSLLESVKDVKLKEPSQQEQKFSDVVQKTEKAAVMIIVY